MTPACSQIVKIFFKMCMCVYTCVCVYVGRERGYKQSVNLDTEYTEIPNAVSMFYFKCKII